MLVAWLQKPFTLLCCILIFVVVAALTLLVVVQVSHIAGGLVTDGIQSVQEMFGISVKYSTVSILPPLRVVIRNLEFSIGDTQIAQADSIAISANLFKLLFNPSVGAVRQIYVRRADVLINQQLLGLAEGDSANTTTGDSNGQTTASDDSGSRSDETKQATIDIAQLKQISSLIDEVLVQLTTQGAALRVAHSRVIIEGVSAAIEIGSIDIVTRSQSQHDNTDVEISATYAIQPYSEQPQRSPLDSFNEPGAVFATGAVVAGANHPAMSLAVTVQAPVFNAITLMPLQFGIDYQAGVAQVRSRNDEGAALLQGSLNMHTGIALADITLNELALQDVIAASPATESIFTVYQRLQSPTLSATIHATYHLIKQSLQYGGTVQIADSDTVVANAGSDNSTETTLGNLAGVYIQFSGDEQRCVITTSAQQQGTQQLAGEVTLDLINRNAVGEIVLSRLTVAPSIVLNGAIEIFDTEPHHTTISGNGLSIGGLSLPHLQSSVRFTDEFAQAHLNIGFDEENSQQLSIIGFVYGNQSQGADVTLYAQDVMVSAIASAFTNQQQANATPLGISSSIQAKIAANNVDFVINSLDLFDHAAEQYLFQMRGAGNNQQIVIDTFVISLSGQPVISQAININTISSGAYQIVFNNTIDANSLPTILEYRHGRFLRVESSPFMRGVVVLNGASMARYFVSITDHTLAINSMLANYSLKSSGYFNSTTDWRVQKSTLAVTLSQIITQQYASNSIEYQTSLIGSISTTLSASPSAVDIEQLQWSSDGGIMAGDALVAFTQQGTSIALDMANINGPDSIAAQAMIPRTAPQFPVGELNIQSLSVHHLIGKQPTLSGALNANATFGATEQSGFDISGSLSTEDAVVGNFPLTLASDIRINESDVIIDDIDMQMIGFEIADAVAQYDIIDQSFSLSAFVDQQYRQSVIPTDPVVVATPHPFIQGTLSVNGALSSDSAQASAAAVLNYVQVRFDHTDAAQFAPLSLRADYESGTDSYIVTDQVNQALAGSISSSTLNLRAQAPFPVQFNAYGTIEPGKTDLTIVDIFVDVGAAPRLADLGFIRFIEGEITGALRMTSREQQPGVKMYGVLSISDLSLDVSYIPYRVGALTGDIVLEDNAMYIRRLYAPVEEEWGAYLALTFVFEQGLLNQFIVNIETLDTVPIPARYDFGAIGFDVLVSGSISLEGSNGALRLIEGDLVAETGSVVVRRNRSNTPRSPNQNSFAMDLSISTGSQVEMLWPTQELPIIRAIADFDQSIQVTIPPQSSEVFIDGDIAFRGGEIFYFERNFLIGEGSVTMNRVEGRIDPIVNLRAELREFTDRGPVNIYLVLENNFLSQLQPRLESTPALSQGEIARVMGNIIINPTASGSINEAQIALEFAGDFLARITVLRDFESALQTALNLFDIVTVRTEVFQNVLFDLVEFDSAVIPSEQLSINRYLDNTSLYLGKYIAERLFFQVELGLTADNNLPAVSVATDDLVLDTTLSFELQSPIGLVSWNIAPDFSQSVALNNTVDVEWSYVY